MYLINETYFIREYNIPNVNELQGNSKTQLMYYIDEKSRLLLRDLLGSMFADFDSNMTNGVLNTNAPQIWKDLVNGKEYTKDGVDYIWKGILDSDGTFKKSVLTPYVYYYWLKDNVSSVMGVGEVRSESANAISVNSTQRLVNSWNDFVTQWQGSSLCKTAVKYIKDGVVVTDYYGSDNKNTYVNLLQFLQDNKESYPNVNLITFDFENQFGL